VQNCEASALSDPEARQRRFVLAEIVERTGDDSLQLHLLHRLFGIRDALCQLIEVLFGQDGPRANTSNAPSAPRTWDSFSPNWSYQLRNDAVRRRAAANAWQANSAAAARIRKLLEVRMDGTSLQC
jgi:hypothetical protein